MVELLSSEQLAQYLERIARFRVLKPHGPAEETSLPTVSIAVTPVEGTVAVLPLLMPVGGFFAQAAWRAKVTPAPLPQEPAPKAAPKATASHVGGEPVVGTVGTFFARVSWSKTSAAALSLPQENNLEPSVGVLPTGFSESAVLTGSVHSFFTTAQWTPDASGAVAVLEPPVVEAKVDSEDFFSDIHWD
jgi:hypothetical protein